MDAQASRRLAMENNLRWALQRGEFFLNYQPEVNVRPAGSSASRRWSAGSIRNWDWFHPSQFIPLAEETGLIVPLGEWVLRTACQQNKTWQESGYPPVRVAVNISRASSRL